MNEPIVYDKTLEAADFAAWVRQRTNLVTLIVLILEAVVLVASIVIAIVGLTKGAVSGSRVVTELLLVLFCLAFLLYWRYQYPKNAGNQYFRKYKQEQDENGPRTLTFFDDRFETRLGETVTGTVSYNDVKKVTVKDGIVSIDTKKRTCYVLRADGFDADDLSALIQTMTAPQAV